MVPPLRLPRRLLAAALDLLFPPRCVACDAPAWDGPLLCFDCAGRIPPPEQRCPRCGRPCGPGVHAAPCARCAGEPSRLDGVVAAWTYAGLPRTLVVGFKFRGRPEVAEVLGRGLADALRGAGIPGDLLVPVPLSRRRRRERGFNQAALLARVVGRELRLDLGERALVRHRHTPPQVGQSPGRRRRSPRGAFRADRARVSGCSVLLVDDVLTTGATAEACAAALRRSGARSVVAAVACRA